MSDNSRIHWVDSAKALAIVLIVLGHVLRVGIIRNVVYSFHVPVFFFLAGMTIREDGIKKRICNDAKRLLVPYFFFGLVSIAIYLVLGSFAASLLDESYSTSLWGNLFELLGGTCRANRPLWFLPSLFATKLFYYFLHRILRGNKYLLVLFATAAVITSFYYTNRSVYPLPFSFELSLKLFVFFLAGKLCVPILCRTEMCLIKKQLLLLGILLLISTFILASLLPAINYTSNTFPKPLWFYATASLGCIGLCLVSMRMQKLLWLRYVGRKTLPILVMHKFPVVFFQTVGPVKELLKNPDSLKSFFLGAIPVTMLSIALCLVAGYVIEKTCPCLLGVSEKRVSVQR